MKELSKTIQDLKQEVETTKKTQRETTLEIETLGKKSGTIDASISNRIQEIEQRISSAEDTTKKKKKKKPLTQQSKRIDKCALYADSFVI
jgi:predicted  nucleic acid-binding Zn-ribbon protein